MKNLFSLKKPTDEDYRPTDGKDVHVKRLVQLCTPERLKDTAKSVDVEEIISLLQQIMQCGLIQSQTVPGLFEASISDSKLLGPVYQQARGQARLGGVKYAHGEIEQQQAAFELFMRRVLHRGAFRELCEEMPKRFKKSYQEYPVVPLEIQELLDKRIVCEIDLRRMVEQPRAALEDGEVFKNDTLLNTQILRLQALFGETDLVRILALLDKFHQQLQIRSDPFTQGVTDIIGATKPFIKQTVFQAAPKHALSPGVYKQLLLACFAQDRPLLGKFLLYLSGEFDADCASTNVEAIQLFPQSRLGDALYCYGLGQILLALPQHYVAGQLNPLMPQRLQTHMELVDACAQDKMGQVHLFTMLQWAILNRKDLLGAFYLAGFKRFQAWGSKSKTLSEAENAFSNAISILRDRTTSSLELENNFVKQLLVELLSTYHLTNTPNYLLDNLGPLLLVDADTNLREFALNFRHFQRLCEGSPYLQPATTNICQIQIHGEDTEFRALYMHKKGNEMYPFIGELFKLLESKTVTPKKWNRIYELFTRLLQEGMSSCSRESQVLALACSYEASLTYFIRYVSDGKQFYEQIVAQGKAGCFLRTLVYMNIILRQYYMLSAPILQYEALSCALHLDLDPIRTQLADENVVLIFEGQPPAQSEEELQTGSTFGQSILEEKPQVPETSVATQPQTEPEAELVVQQEVKIEPEPPKLGSMTVQEPKPKVDHLNSRLYEVHSAQDFMQEIQPSPLTVDYVGKDFRQVHSIASTFEEMCEELDSREKEHVVGRGTVSAPMISPLSQVIVPGLMTDNEDTRLVDKNGELLKDMESSSSFDEIPVINVAPAASVSVASKLIAPGVHLAIQQSSPSDTYRRVEIYPFMSYKPFSPAIVIGGTHELVHEPPPICLSSQPDPVVDFYQLSSQDHSTVLHEERRCQGGLISPLETVARCTNKIGYYSAKNVTSRRADSRLVSQTLDQLSRQVLSTLVAPKAFCSAVKQWDITPVCASCGRELVRMDIQPKLKVSDKEETSEAPVRKEPTGLFCFYLNKCFCAQCGKSSGGFPEITPTELKLRICSQQGLAEIYRDYYRPAFKLLQLAGYVHITDELLLESYHRKVLALLKTRFAECEDFSRMLSQVELYQQRPYLLKSTASYSLADLTQMVFQHERKEYKNLQNYTLYTELIRGYSMHAPALYNLLHHILGSCRWCREKMSICHTCSQPLKVDVQNSKQLQTIGFQCKDCFCFFHKKCGRGGLCRDCGFSTK